MMTSTDLIFRLIMINRIGHIVFNNATSQKFPAHSVNGSIQGSDKVFLGILLNNCIIGMLSTWEIYWFIAIFVSFPRFLGLFCGIGVEAFWYWGSGFSFWGLEVAWDRLCVCFG